MPLVDPADEEALGALAPAFELVEAHMGFVPNSLKTMARRPDLANAFMGLSFAALGPSSSLEQDLKSLIGHAASAAHGCLYCQAHTTHSAARAGVDEAKLAALWDYEKSPLFSAPERAAMRFAQCAAQTPSLVTDTEIKDLKAHFNDDEITDIVAVIALFGFLNRWNDTMATTLEDAPADVAASALGGRGWQAGKHKS